MIIILPNTIICVVSLTKGVDLSNSMATKSSLRSKWDEFVDSSTATAVELSGTSQMTTGVRNVVGWLKQV